MLLACSGTLLLGACSVDSALPEATGKSSVRAINAIPSSPSFSFLIEERSIGLVGYKGASSPSQYDDLDYTFNFEVLLEGQSSRRRVASEHVEFDVDRDYTLLISGAVSSPAITLWDVPEREFTETDTVFQVSFAHTAESLGAIDYYWAAPAVAPAPENKVATLSFGDISDAVDFAEGEFVLTITVANDPAAVLYASEATSFLPRNSFIVTPFDGDASDTAPLVARAFGSLAGTIAMPDRGFPPTVEFVNASPDLGISDIYDDEDLTSRRVADHNYLGVSAELELAIGSNTFYYTPAGDTTMVSLEAPLSAFSGTRYRIIAAGLAGSITPITLVPNRATLSTSAKMLPYHASNNFDFIDIYAVDAGDSIDEAIPVRQALAANQSPETVLLASGTFDFYITEFQEKTVLAGPYRIDVAAGDIVDMIIADTVDPNVVDVLFLSGGPAP